MAKNYLKQHRRVLYLNLLTAGMLNGHLTEIEQMSAPVIKCKKTPELGRVGRPGRAAQGSV